MPDDLPGPPGSGDREDQPRGDRPTEPLGGPPPSQPPTAPGPPTTPGTPTAPVPEPPPGAGQTWPEAPQPPPQGYGQPGYGPPPPGYGQPGYGQPPYGAPPGYGYGYPAGPQNDSTATAALVIAVVGFFICPPVGAIVALVLANSAQKRIEESGGRLTGIEQARAARIIAIIELVLTGIAILVGVIAIIASMGARY
jgi:hypothetical protein